MKLLTRGLIAFALCAGPLSIEEATARDADTERVLNQLGQEVRTLTDQVRRLHDEVRTLATHRAVVLIEVPRDFSPAKADALCHQLGGALQVFLPNVEPGAGKLLCRF